MKQTVLQMTQTILSSLSSDEVNSISDTTESMQVANIIKQKYFDIVSRVPLPENEQLIQLDPSLDPTIPVMMFVPDGIGNIEELKYFNTSQVQNTNTTSHGINVDLTPQINYTWSTSSTTSNSIGIGTKVFTVLAGLPITAGDFVTAAYTGGTSNYMYGTVTTYVGTTLTILVSQTNGAGTYVSWTIAGGNNLAPPAGYQYVSIIPLRQFLDMTNGFNPSESDIASFTFTDSIRGFPGTYTFYYKTDRQPMYCTIINNYYIIFDSYDASQDSTLQASKTMAWGKVVPTFSMVDSFIPDLKEDQFPLLLNEAKSLAFFELKQSAHPKADQETRRGWSVIQRDKAVANRPRPFDALPNFGRPNYSGISFFKLKGWDRP